MIFSSIEFFLFFAAVILFLTLAKGQQTKKYFLLAASYFFYGYWDWRFTFLMLAMTVVNYVLGHCVERARSLRIKRLSLVTAIVFDLGVLGFFKYYNFFVESANYALRSLGSLSGASQSAGLSSLDIILPVGISFITFQVMAYVIDIYRGVTGSAETFWDFALLTAFFPQLVAGPILKAKQFLPELQKKIVIRPQNLLFGAQLFLLGLFRKVVIADRLAIYVDGVFDQPQDFSTPTVWLAVIAYAIQIYCDFSGYSDMAIGAARCLGYEIPINFNLPYISRSITEFWRRWHISLSTWLREYLYIPLGGNRKGKPRQYLNLWLVMLIGGLWHGASWNFVLWGALHGTALAVHKFYADTIRSHIKLPSFIYNGLTWLLTLLFVCSTWVLFRVTDFSSAFVILQKMYLYAPMGGINWYSTGLMIALPAVIVADYLGHVLNQGRYLKLNRFSHWFWISFWLLGLLFLAPQDPQPFVYFQF
ncbi:MAG: MBOAT family protein [Cyanobacteria bacterium P01_F01_bin.53]